MVVDHRKYWTEDLVKTYISFLYDLQVEPFASLASAVRGSVPRLLINRDLVGPFAWGSPRRNDVGELGDVVSGVSKLADALGWTEELKALGAAETNKVGNWSVHEQHSQTHTHIHTHTHSHIHIHTHAHTYRHMHINKMVFRTANNHCK